MTFFTLAHQFNSLVASARVVNLPDDLWYPVFTNEEEAFAFARHVEDFPRHIIPGSKTTASVTWSEDQTGFVARLSIDFPDWGTEEGLVVCRDNYVAGLFLEQKGSTVFLPIKAYRATLRTDADSLYVLYIDGTAFCRVIPDGAVAPTAAIWFAHDLDQALAAQADGGVVQVAEEPELGLIPLHIFEAPTTCTRSWAREGYIWFERESFRCATPVASVIAR